MPQVKDYYKTFGVSEQASSDEIRSVYRKLARQYHPDKNPGDVGAEERFKEIQEAYEVLSNPEKRKQYDAMRRNPFGGAGFGGGAGPAEGGSRVYRAPDGTYVRFESEPGEPFDPGVGGFGGFGDIFSRIFGGFDEGPAEPQRARPRPRGPQPSGLDVDTRLRLTFEQALQGGKREVTLPGGDKIRINIPKGVRPGFRIRLKEHGEPGPIGKKGDLYVTFDVEPSPRFHREADNLTTRETISAIEATLGTTKEITNAYGKTIKLPIPAGTQHGERLRLRGQGVETSTATGDLYVEVQVLVPRNLTDEQVEELRTVAKKLKLI